MRAAALALAFAVLAAPAEAHNDGCSRRGDAAGISCQLARWVHCSGGAVRVTTFNANSRRACKAVIEQRDNDVYIVADKRLACGARITLTNATTGQSVAAVVGDRGPGTIATYDLSHRTAAKLGIGGSGCVYANRDMEMAR